MRCQYIALLAVAAQTLAAPTPTPTTAAASPTLGVTKEVLTVPQVVVGPSRDSLLSKPADLRSEASTLLQTYQVYANNASDIIGSKQSDKFPASGWCYREYPCFSVGRVSVVETSSSAGQSLPALTPAQITQLMDLLLSTSEITFDDSNPDTVLSGLKATAGGATLEIIAPKSTVPSTFIAGMVFDTYKASTGSANNAVRAVQAQQDGGPTPMIAICLFPEGSDTAASRNFCLGKELDGSVPNTATSKRHLSARFSLESLFSGFCHLIDIPLLCPTD